MSIDAITDFVKKLVTQVIDGPKQPIEHYDPKRDGSIEVNLQPSDLPPGVYEAWKARKKAESDIGK